MLHAGAFNWTYTLGAGLTDPWAVGATALVYAGPPEREVWPRLAGAHGATIFAAAPGVYRQMLGDPGLGRGFAGLRHGLSAGEALPEAVRARLDRGDRQADLRGARHVGGLDLRLVLARPARRSPGAPAIRSAGGAWRSCPTTATTPVPRGEDGLLAVSRRDPGLMLGYWRRPEETAAAFRGEWFVTGDRARMDADGAIAHLGRADDVMNAGGFRVSPAEVEAALIGASRRRRGGGRGARGARGCHRHRRLLCAARTAPVPEAELAAHCAGRLARYNARACSARSTPCRAGRTASSCAGMRQAPDARWPSGGAGL